VGPRDVQNNRAVLVRRDRGSKELAGLEALAERVAAALAAIQSSLFEEALSFQRANTHVVFDYEEFKEVIESRRGFIKTWWCGEESCEDKIKEETMATIRVIPLDADEGKDHQVCVYCRKKAKELAYFARAY
jgi:prolyl-tRNA synthetase